MKRDQMLSLCRFNAQANAAVLEVAARLTGGEFTRDVSPSHGSVQQLLLHILGGEVFFPAVCEGRAVDMQALETLETLDAIRARWHEANADAEVFIASLDDDELDRMVTVTFGEHSFELPMWQVLLQCFSHSMHHRGELSIVLSELGHPLPTLDLMVYFIQESGQDWPF
jgi:uncharacterized damage-inducible protein DinB